MKTAVIVKNNKLNGYPGDLLIDGEIYKSYNLEFELMQKNVKILIAKSLSSSLIKKLRDLGVTFLKINSFEELEGLDLDIKMPSEFKNRRGWKCGRKGF